MTCVEMHKVKSSTTGLLVVLLACGVLLALRVSSAVTLDVPFLGQTSGLEEEALFSLWKAHHGQSVYSDALAVPFSTSYFNVLFYTAYALWSRFLNFLVPAQDAWLPTVWRLLSLSFCLGAWLILWRVMRTLLDRGAALAALCAAGVCVLNPLFHWMSFSARPDLGAVCCEAAGLALLLRHARNPSIRDVLLAGLLAALAWSFKQSQVFLLAGGVVFLGAHRRWKELVFFVLPPLLTVAVTLALAGEWYRQNTLVLHALVSRFDVKQGFLLAASAMAKAPLMPAGLLLLIPLVRCWRAVALETRLVGVLAGVSLALCLITSSKTGAADYYYLAPCIFATVLVFAALREPAVSWLARRVLAGGVVLQLAVIALIFSGRLGKVSVREDQTLAVRLQQRLKDEPGPLFITGRPYNLPWLHAGRPAFVFSFLYDEYERRLPALRQQGLRSLITSRHFTLVVDVDDPPVDFSRELAAAYTLSETGQGFRLYRPSVP